MGFAPEALTPRRLPRRPPAALAAAPRLPRRDRPGAARGLRPGAPGRARARPRLRRRRRRRSASPRRVPGLELHGLELQPAYAALARRNAAANGLPLAVHEGDLRRPPRGAAAARLRPGARQPAVPRRRGHRRRRTPGRDLAHREGEAALADWIDAGLRRLVPGGRLALVHRPERLGGDARRARRPRRRRSRSCRSPRAPARRRRGCCCGRARARGAADASASLNLPRRKFARSRRRAAILPTVQQTAARHGGAVAGRTREWYWRVEQPECQRLRRDDGRSDERRRRLPGHGDAADPGGRRGGEDAVGRPARR